MTTMAGRLVTVSCLLAVMRTVSGSVGWQYSSSETDLGPEKWYKEYPNCGKRMQSPINIERAEVLYDPKLSPVDLRQYSVCDNCTMVLENVDGHTVEMLYYGDPITIRGGSLPNEYCLDNFHFHWGDEDSRGSEHLLENTAAPMELHIVHHMADQDKSQSAESPYGLAVLAFLFEIDDHNPNYDEFLSYLANVTERNASVPVKKFALSKLLPAGAKTYYRYYGSLTTPPCYETVIWTLFKQKIKISKEQIDIFRKVLTIKNDFRPVQDLHERRVTSNDETLYNNVTAKLMEELREEIHNLRNLLLLSAADRPSLTLFSAIRLLLVILLAFRLT